MQLAETQSASLEALTQKQREVLDLVLRHKSSKEIARTLGISPHTVEQRLKLARTKLGATTRGELAREYGRLCAMYEESVYDFSDLDSGTSDMQERPRDQQVDPVFMLADSASFEFGLPWHETPHQPVGLETFDNRFGIFGRVVAVFGLAVMLVLLVLALMAIAVTITTYY